MAASASCRLSAGASQLNVYCSRGVQPARFDVLKANAYIDHDSVDIVCRQWRSVIASARTPTRSKRSVRFGSPPKDRATNA